MEYPGHTFEFLEALTDRELLNRQRSLTAELRDPKSPRNSSERLKMQEDLRLIQIILKQRT